MTDLLSQMLPPSLETQGINVWIVCTVLLAAIGFVGATGKHFLKREEKLHEAMLARETAMTTKLDRMEDFQRSALLGLATSQAALTEKAMLVIQQSSASQQELTETIRQFATTLHELVREIGIERVRKSG